MNVLIVEDDTCARKMLRITLEHYLCTVIEAVDGQEGLELAYRHRPDVIISDALMPRMDGFQLLRALKRDPELRVIPFIFYSSTYTGEKEHELALSLGAEAFINKPTEPAELWEKTCSIMQAWEARQKMPAHPAIDESDEQYLREYSQIVATKLEEKVRELEDALALRKQAEEELRRLNIELEQRVAQEVQKNQAKDRILAYQARLTAMGEMLSNIAHQWRQPLNNVSLIVQNLQAEFDDGALTKVSCSEYVGECINILMYMSKTIDNFCAFYQPDSGRQSFDLYHAIAESTTLIKEDLESRGITLRLVKDHDLAVHGFKKEFSQVLLNVIQNAKEAILLRQSVAPFVEIVCSPADGFARVTIKDNGGGIPSEILDKIFDPYFTSKFKSQGAGMGLYMSKMIIEKHMGGKISIANTVEGAEVTIELPLESGSVA
ncbi:Histidine kinase-, DNA gyrase B-, and HSP90-like ATPase [Trichlorobacter thiogenes]|uniref:histidine kinase n=1 Tax=Trichlorobacter thiogenes TaxID=115783 RepID=A0A1T4KHP1_9BACT|nr:hybrid sensor histidine kinase/response regulator [Trichlorobacter thiogenes]SJZ41921.1 Histidine kinase-, DNA gyrase B-, and HSP90-like ATPase [Trichlorobacter thiogenes]